MNFNLFWFLFFLLCVKKLLVHSHNRVVHSHNYSGHVVHSHNHLVHSHSHTP